MKEYNLASFVGSETPEPSFTNDECVKWWALKGTRII